MASEECKLTHRSRKRIKETKKKARPGKNIKDFTIAVNNLQNSEIYYNL